MHQIVGHVDEKGPRRVDFDGGIEGLGDGEVGWVWSMTEGIEDEGVCGLEFFERWIGDVGDIGAVGEGEQVRVRVGHIEDEAKDGELAVVEGDGCDVESEELEGLVGFDDVGDELGDEGFLDVFVRLEDVLIDAGEGGHGVLVGVDIDWLIHDLIESSDFVEAEGVIDMVVCIEDGVDA